MAEPVAPKLAANVAAKLAAAPWLKTPSLRGLIVALAPGGQTRIVGGAVRNTLLGLPVTDIDLATTALPDAVMQLAVQADLSAYPTGLAHGTVTVVSGGVPFEVTTLRRDVETDGRRAVVAFTTDWAEDARRRDFTINALYANADGEIFDYVGGLADLGLRKLRFIGDAHARIREDYLRILRFFRFTAQYGLTPLDSDGLDACRDLKSGIANLSGERIGSEMLKLVVAPRAADVVPAMAQTGVLDAVLGGQSRPQVLQKLIVIETDLDIAPDAAARLAALIPASASIDDLAQRLRLSSEQAADLRAAHATSDPAFEPQTSERAARVHLYRIGSDAFARAARVAWARSEFDGHDTAFRARATLAQRWRAPQLPLRGADIIALGVPAGPRVGRILAAFESWWLDHDFTPDTAVQKAKLTELLFRA